MTETRLNSVGSWRKIMPKWNHQQQTNNNNIADDNNDDDDVLKENKKWKARKENSRGIRNNWILNVRGIEFGDLSIWVSRARSDKTVSIEIVLVACFFFRKPSNLFVTTNR